MAKSKATPQQLAALKKARAQRKKNLAKKKKIASRSKTVKRKSPSRRKITSRKKAVKRRVRRNPSESLSHYIFAQRGNKGTKYYLQKINNKWVFDSNKPEGMSKKSAANAIKVATRFLKRLPGGVNIYQETGKKR